MGIDIKKLLEAPSPIVCIVVSLVNFGAVLLWILNATISGNIMLPMIFSLVHFTIAVVMVFGAFSGTEKAKIEKEEEYRPKKELVVRIVVDDVLDNDILDDIVDHIIGVLPNTSIGYHYEDWKN